MTKTYGNSRKNSTSMRSSIMEVHKIETIKVFNRVRAIATIARISSIVNLI